MTRFLINILLLLTPLLSFGQTAEDYLKTKVYKTSSGQIYSQENVDSLRYRTNQYIGIKKIKETTDSVYYSITHFDKDHVADIYQVQGYYCGNSERKSLDEIKKKFPYKDTYTIEVVSFKDYSIPKTSGKIDFKKMYEVKTLGKELEDKMIDILANYHNENFGLGMQIAFCWAPRNAVVLLDKSGKVLSYIEICFECQQFYFEPKLKPPYFGLFCNEKMDAIQGIMKRAGITYGMKRNKD